MLQQHQLPSVKPMAAWIDGEKTVTADQPDIEAQTLDKETYMSASPSPTTSSPDSASRTATTSNKRFHLTLYFLLNLSLTFFNKALLNNFHFPWTLTVMHSGITALVCSLVIYQDSDARSNMRKLSPREHMVLILYSILFTLNIAMSNVSLDAVSVAFHQTIRATCPVITIILSFVIFQETYPWSTILSTIPIMLGAAIAAANDYQFTVIGCVVTIAGVFLASIKTIVTNRLLTGRLKLPPLEFLLRMSPFAAIQCTLLAYATGELADLQQMYQLGHLHNTMLLSLCANGALAAALNVSSMYTNRAVGALTMTTAANVKQCATIGLGIVLFNINVGILNGCGIIMTLAGAAWYARIELARKN